MLKLIGVIFVVLGSTGAGVTMAWGARRTLETARQLRVALERMKNEIACHRTALPELMELLSRETGPLSALFGGMAEQLFKSFVCGRRLRYMPLCARAWPQHRPYRARLAGFCWNWRRDWGNMTYNASSIPSIWPRDRPRR